MSEAKREKAKRLSEAEPGLTQAAIAQRIGVAQRTVERWASEDGWGARRKAEGKVVSISTPRSNHQNPPSVKRQRKGEPLEELEMVEGVVESLYLLLLGMSAGGIQDDSGHQQPIDTRGIGGTAGAFVRLLEYRRKIAPPTAAALAEQAIALGLSPSEFVTELKRQWQQRA